MMPQEIRRASSHQLSERRRTITPHTPIMAHWRRLVLPTTPGPKITWREDSASLRTISSGSESFCGTQIGYHVTDSDVTIELMHYLGLLPRNAAQIGRAHV